MTSEPVSQKNFFLLFVTNDGKTKLSFGVLGTSLGKRVDNPKKCFLSKNLIIWDKC